MMMMTVGSFAIWMWMGCRGTIGVFGEKGVRKELQTDMKGKR